MLIDSRLEKGIREHERSNQYKNQTSHLHLIVVVEEVRCWLQTKLIYEYIEKVQPKQET